MLFVEERGNHVLLPRCKPHHTAGSESMPQRHWTHQATPQSDALHISIRIILHTAFTKPDDACVYLDIRRTHLGSKQKLGKVDLLRDPGPKSSAENYSLVYPPNSTLIR
jgi:hypothetical protein